MRRVRLRAFEKSGDRDFARRVHVIKILFGHLMSASFVQGLG
jgi:hypothetical protein